MVQHNEVIAISVVVAIVVIDNRTLLINNLCINFIILFFFLEEILRVDLKEVLYFSKRAHAILYCGKLEMLRLLKSSRDRTFVTSKHYHAILEQYKQ